MDAKDTRPEVPVKAAAKAEYVIRLLKAKTKSGKKDDSGQPVYYQAVTLAIFEKGATTPIWQTSAPKAMTLISLLQNDGGLLARIKNVAQQAPKAAPRAVKQMETLAEG